MELHQVRYLLAVVEARNFTRAAERCGVSQPALTSAIRKLEDELGGPLLHRDRSGATLSRLGELLLPRLERMLEDEHSVADLARNYAASERAPLRVGVLSTIGPRKLAGLLQTFRARAPGVELELEVTSLERLYHHLEDRSIEVALGASASQGPGWLVSRTLYEEEYRVVLPPGHALLEQDSIALADLDGEHYVDRLACERRGAFSLICRERSIDLRTGYRTEDDHWAEALVNAGVGIAFMPVYSVLSPQSSQRPLVDPRLAREVCLWRSVDAPPTPAAKLFWKTLAEATLDT